MDIPLRVLSGNFIHANIQYIHANIQLNDTPMDLLIQIANITSLRVHDFAPLLSKQFSASVIMQSLLFANGIFTMNSSIFYNIITIEIDLKMLSLCS